MKRSEVIGYAITLPLLAAMIFIGQQYRQVIEAATAPVLGLMYGKSPEGVFLVVALIAASFAVTGYFLASLGRRIYRTCGEGATDVFTSVLSGVTVVLLLYSALPLGLMVFWVVSMFAGACFASLRM